MKILIIEDDDEIIEIVSQTIDLRWPEASLISTSEGKTGVMLAEKELPDLIILDLGLPDIDGFEVVRQIRGFSSVPLVILTVRDEEMNKIRGLELGADDYVVKPFSPGEFLARMKALLRRGQMAETKVDFTGTPYLRGRLRIDFNSEEVSFDNKLVKLSPRGYDLLRYLVMNAGTVIANEAIMKEIFPEQGNDTRFIDVYVRKIREALGESPDDPKIIITEGNTGYKFVD